MKLMSRLLPHPDDLKNLKPFLSILLIISTLFALVFLQMEERRMGYSLLKLTRDQRKVIEERRQRSSSLAKITRPERVERLAQSRMSLKKVQANQIIHLTGSQDGLHNRDVN
jgi:uncharacterized membrane protein (DUF106 family)